MNLLQNLLDLFLEAAPWLLLGLVLAGLLKAWLPENLLREKLGRGRFLPILKATLVGAPLPLCSCGVLPAAMGLRRSGASRSSTLAFMISTPETGPDSIALTYALLGPFMAVVRPVAAILSALFTGVLGSLLLPPEEPARPLAVLPVVDRQACSCDGGTCCDTPVNKTGDAWQRTRAGLRYAFTDILDDIWLWLIAGLLLAALVTSYLPADSLAAWGSGPAAMLMMLLIGIPMYICATASTPLAAAMMLAGVSPGTVLVFLLAGPATNLATMGVIRREMGGRALGLYLLGISLSSVLIGLAVDRLIAAWGLSVEVVSTGQTWELSAVPAVLSGVVLMLMFLGSLRRWLGKGFAERTSSSAS